MTYINTGGMNGNGCNTKFDKFFRLASNCIGTENSIEECGGIVEVDSCTSCSIGALLCELGK